MSEYIGPEIPLRMLGSQGGVATLDEKAKLNESQLPSSVASDSRVPSSIAGQVVVKQADGGWAPRDGGIASIQELFGQTYISVTRVTTTITAALAQAAALNTFPAKYDGHPGLRRAVLVPPGTYVEDTLTWGANQYIDLIGETLNPDDVLIKATGEGSTGDTITIGNNCLYAGVTVENDIDGGKFPLHIVFGGRDARCTLFRVNAVSTGTGGHAYAAQLLGSQMIYARECNFTATNGSAVYVHNLEPAVGREAAAVFDDCTASGSSYGLEVLDKGADCSTLVWAGGAASITGGMKDILFNQSAGSPTWTLLASAGSYETITNTVGTAYAAVWPQGLPAPKPATDRLSFYGGDDRGLVIPFAPLIPDAAEALVTQPAGFPSQVRQYYWPVRITRLCRLGSLMVGIGSTGAGNANLLIYSDSAGKPGTLITSTGSKAATGANARLSGTIAERVIYPGVYWLAAVFDSNTVKPLSSVAAPLVQAMYYQDVAAITTAPNPATPVALASGPVPIVTGVTK